MRFLDTNIFIRFLTDDDPEKADACEKTFKKAVKKEETLFTTDMVIAEIVWVLESFYKLPKNEVRDKIEKILNTTNLICPHKNMILSALILYSEKNIDYIDAYNALIMKEKGIKELYSYDKHYDRIDWLTRLEP
ncbi:MAG: PIN domain-containing protein [Thermodesulfobacteriota bacterium]|nr:PIN domain-containing protein [Thermodesulfobacteriota bacterium]